VNEWPCNATWKPERFNFYPMPMLGAVTEPNITTSSGAGHSSNNFSSDGPLGPLSPLTDLWNAAAAPVQPLASIKFYRVSL
jgi:hypothetical protein